MATAPMNCHVLPPQDVAMIQTHVHDWISSASRNEDGGLRYRLSPILHFLSRGTSKKELIALACCALPVRRPPTKSNEPKRPWSAWHEDVARPAPSAARWATHNNVDEALRDPRHHGVEGLRVAQVPSGVDQ